MPLFVGRYTRALKRLIERACIQPIGFKPSFSVTLKLQLITHGGPVARGLTLGSRVEHQARHTSP